MELSRGELARPHGCLIVSGDPGYYLSDEPVSCLIVVTATGNFYLGHFSELAVLGRDEVTSRQYFDVDYRKHPMKDIVRMNFAEYLFLANVVNLRVNRFMGNRC
ncbi:hypothetical protein BKCO1_6000196 [Neofusicoccum parvum]|nr:hypothetical protein BKCO1_6000196 [Neofusicoccum parvum]